MLCSVYEQKAVASAPPNAWALRFGTPLALVQHAQHGIVQFAVAGDDIRPVDVGLAVPRRHAAARFLDDHLQSSEIPGVTAVLEHNLARTLRHQHETVEVAVTALPLR